MPLVYEDRTKVRSTSATITGVTSYKMYPWSIPEVSHLPDANLVGAVVRTESQTGYRTRPGSGKTREPGLPPTIQKWSDGPKLIQYLDALEYATSTSPRGARGNFAINPRDFTRFETGSRVLTFPLSYSFHESVGGRSWDWHSDAGVRIPLLAPPPIFSRGTSDPDFSKALRDMRPTKPHAELATFVAELGDAPRSVATLLANMRGQELSQGPINYMFGIAPAISDIKSLAKAVSSSSRITNKFIENSGRTVRRSRSWSEPAVVTTSSFDTGVWAPRYSTPSITFYAQVDLTRKVQRSYKVGAAYQYYVADSSGFLSRAARYRQMADHLLGSNLDAATLWELTPWSWLVDWSVDIGGLISYQEDVVDDSLVLRGGYSSIFDRVTDTYKVTVSSNRDSDPSWAVSTPTTLSFTTEAYYRHKRRPADPFAWSPSAEVTPRRAAILAALGLSRAA